MGGDSPPRPPASVRVIRRATAVLRQRRGAFVATAGAILFCLLAMRGVYTVDNGESAALLRFGALVDDTLAPGLHFRFPVGVDLIVKERTGEIVRLPVHVDDRPRLALVTGDENLIEAALTVQYRIVRLGSYLFDVESLPLLVAQTVRAAAVEATAGVSVDDMLTIAKAAVQQEVRHRAQELLDRYGSGVSLVTVNLQSVDPPPEAATAFRDVLDARAEGDEIVSRAQAAREAELSLARGEASQVLAAVAAETDWRLQEARGAADRFGQLLGSHRAAPDQTRNDLHTQMLRRILPRARIIVLAPGAAPAIDVNLMPPAERIPRPPPVPGDEP